MKAMGVREVKAKLSEVLRAVERGEVVQITSHGRIVAEIAPPRSADEHLERLVREGLATPPSAPMGPWPKPIRTARPVSDLIQAERNEYY